MKEWLSMNALVQQTEFLSRKIVPARLDALQAAWFLGFETREIPILIAAGLLKPLCSRPDGHCSTISWSWWMKPERVDMLIRRTSTDRRSHFFHNCHPKGNCMNPILGTGI
jgi:hypothetical protein